MGRSALGALALEGPVSPGAPGRFVALCISARERTFPKISSAVPPVALKLVFLSSEYSQR